MRNPGTTLEAPPPETVPRRLVAVVDETAGAPGWAVSWDRRSGREFEVYPIDVSVGLPGIPVADRCARLATRIAALVNPPEATAVLVTRGTLARSRTPRVVAAIRRLPADDAVIAVAVDAAGLLGAGLSIAHAVPTSFAERSVGLAEALDRGSRILDDALDRASTLAPDLAITAGLVRTHPHELVGEDLDADLLVLGGPRVGPRSRLGLVVRSALHHAPCPVLLVPGSV